MSESTSASCTVATSDGRFYDLDTEKIRSIEKRIAGLKRKLSLN